MKIMLVNNLYEPHRVGGAERSAQLLAEGLREQGCSPVVVCLRPDGGDAKRNVNGVPVHYLRLRNLYWPWDDSEHPAGLVPFWYMLDTFNPFVQKKMKALISSHHPDLIHTNNLMGFSVSAWTTAHSMDVPVVHTLRDYYLMCLRSNRYRNRSRCEKRCLDCRLFSIHRPQLSSRVDTVVGISRHILDRHLRAGMFEGRCQTRVIRNPVDVPDRGHSWDGGGPENEGWFRLGFLGRVAPYKGIEFLLNSFQKVDDNRVRLFVGGEGEQGYYERLRDEHESDRIRFLGFVDPSTFFEQIHVLVVPSLWEEPMGRVVVESFAHAVPVVVSNRGGLPELVDEGRTGHVFDPENPRELRNLIGTLANHPSKWVEMSREAEQEANQYRNEIITEKYRRVYERVLAES